MVQAKGISVLQFGLIILLSGFVERASAKGHVCTTIVKRMECTYCVPEYVPEGVEEVILNPFPLNVTVSRTLFGGKGWMNVSSLSIVSESAVTAVRFEENFLEGLLNLRELHIHVLTITFHPNAFNGSNNVILLDVTNSTRLFDDELKSQVLASGNLPNLKELILTRSGYEAGYDLDETFWRKIEDRPISYLDLSYIRARVLNFTSLRLHCRYLQTLNARGIYIEVSIDTSLFKPACNIEVFDISSFSIPKNVLCYLSEISIQNQTISLDKFNLYSTARKFIFNNMCPMEGPMHYFRNVRNISFTSLVPWYLEELSLNNGRLAYLDVELECRQPWLKSLSLAENSMEYLSPKFLNCTSTLERLDLSGNRFDLMSTRNASHFEKLLKSLTYLQNISLARNRLTKIPPSFFANNSGLQTLDLSGNALEQVHFQVSHLHSLRTLNLSNNAIGNLDEDSRNKLASITNFGKVEIDLRGNPLACKKCEDLSSIQWLIKIKPNISIKHDVACLSEDKSNLVIDLETPNAVKDKSNRPTRIIIGTSTGLLTVCLSLTLVVLFWKRGLAKRKENRLRQLFNKITNKQPGFEFVAFLSYSSADDVIVQRHMIPSLKKTLEQAVGVERGLLCLGDYQYRAGYPLHDETVRCLNMSCVVIFVVSDSFCRSDYCQYEFIQAKEMGKPVILMIKEACDKGLMHPLLKEVFERNTRVVWLSEGDNFILKNTWEHVCVYSDLSLFVRLIYSVLVINLGISDQFKKY